MTTLLEGIAPLLTELQHCTVAAQPEVIARLPTGACQGTILEPKMSSARRLSTATPQDGGPISGAARERARAIGGPVGF